jgi:hypothetical protein
MKGMAMWQVVKSSMTGDMHVIPKDDKRPHLPMAHCWCNPELIEDDEEIWVHNAFDGRNDYED